MKVSGEELLIQLIREAIKTDNNTQTAEILKKRFGLSVSSQNIRKWIGVTKAIAERDDLSHTDLLTLTHETLNKEGEVIGQKFGLRSDIPSTKGMAIQKITTTPFGGAFVSYKPNSDLFDVFSDDYIEQLTKALKKEIEPVEFTAPVDASEKTLLCVISDRHVGASLEPNSLYDNEYNPTAYKERLDNVLGRILDYVSQNGKFKRLILMDLGDSLDGYESKTTRGGHTLTQNLTSAEQCDVFVDNEKRLWDNLISHQVAEQFDFYAATNCNHAGVFGYQAMKNVETYLNVKYPFITTLVSRRFLDHFKIGGHAIIFTHGKDEKNMKHGLPYFLNPKTELLLNQYIEDRGLNKHNCRVIKGDLHQSGLNEGKMFNYINVPSLFGGSGYIQTNFGKSKAGCYFEVFSEKSQTVEREWYMV